VYSLDCLVVVIPMLVFAVFGFDEASKRVAVLTIYKILFIYTYIYRCPRRNVPDFRRVFLMLKYTDITPNTYIQS